MKRIILSTVAALTFSFSSFAAETVENLKNLRAEFSKNIKTTLSLRKQLSIMFAGQLVGPDEKFQKLLNIQKKSMKNFQKTIRNLCEKSPEGKEHFKKIDKVRAEMNECWKKKDETAFKAKAYTHKTLMYEITYKLMPKLKINMTNPELAASLDQLKKDSKAVQDYMRNKVKTTPEGKKLIAKLDQLAEKKKVLVEKIKAIQNAEAKATPVKPKK